MQTRNESKAWRDWLENLEMCMLIEDVADKEHKLAALKILGGKELRDKIATLTGESATYAECKEKLSEYYEEKRSINAIRHEFFNLKPKNNEATKQYAERCRQIGKECEFDRLSLDDAIILNICKYTPIEKLRSEILVKELNYNQAIKYGSSLETAERESLRMRQHQEEYDIERINKRSNLRRAPEKQENKEECSRCGRSEPHTCRALQATCYKCSRRGHFANKCRSKRVHEIFKQEEDGAEETEEY